MVTRVCSEMEGFPSDSSAAARRSRQSFRSCWSTPPRTTWTGHFCGCAGVMSQGYTPIADRGLGLGKFVFLLPDQGEAVADVPDRADQVLVVRAELGPQAPDVDIHGAGAAVVVVAPYFGEQLLAGEYPAGVLRQVFQELELLKGQVQRRAVDPRRVAGFVDNDAGRTDLAGRVVLLRNRPGDGQPDPGLHFGGAGGIEDDVVNSPRRGYRGHAAFGQDQDQWGTKAGGLQ